MKTSTGIVRTGARFTIHRAPPCRRLHLSRPHRVNPVPGEGHQLDPSLQQLLRDADLSLLTSRKARGKLSSSHPLHDTLEVSESSPTDARSYDPYEEDLEDDRTTEDDIDAWHNRDEKRSTEAIFGSKYVGISSMPEELDRAIAALIDSACPVWVLVASCNFKKSDNYIQTPININFVRTLNVCF